MTQGTQQIPAPGVWLVRFRGDIIEFVLTVPPENAGKAWLRTNIGHAGIRRHELIAQVEEGSALLDRDWHDIPMTKTGDGRYSVRLPLLDTGCFQAKTFLLPSGESEPVWPEGGNVHLKVHPSEYNCANSIYTVFTRQFRSDQESARDSECHEVVTGLDSLGYTVIPRSGTFRDVIGRLDEIINGMGFRIIQLLPIHPTPTTYARMGRFGSPFAAIDFMDVDPALAEFDRRTTPLDQFRELADAVHARGARVFLDIPVNHTGWASTLQIHHPGWFERTPDNAFRSPGAWGVTWEDLSQLNYGVHRLWQYVAEIFLFWCARGVDGFRCDAGYMVPYDVWCYIVAKVREQFPCTVFMLEGLGGKLDVTEALLGTAGLDWAYSEIFQQYGRDQLERYLPDTIRVSREKGTLIHFAETHDNNRLAATSECYASMRTALSALCSDCGGFGITNGVEWFARDKIDVHGAPPLNWGNEHNQVALIRRLNAILRTHPAFGSGADVRLLPQDGGALALLRVAGEGADSALVLVNLDCGTDATVSWSVLERPLESGGAVDLMSGAAVALQEVAGRVQCRLAPGQVRCLVPGNGGYLAAVVASEQSGPEAPRTKRQELKAKALEILVSRRGLHDIDLAAHDPEALATDLARDPLAYCRAIAEGMPCVTSWNWPRDARRVVAVPPGDFLLVRAAHRFHCELRGGEQVLRHEHGMQAADGTWFALLMPTARTRSTVKARLLVTVYENGTCNGADAPLLLLSDGKHAATRQAFSRAEVAAQGTYGLLSNGRGAMLQAMGAWGKLQSQYDALLAANFHPSVPVDRQVILRRCRGWLVYRGYSQEINRECLSRFVVQPGRLVWKLSVPAGLGCIVPIHISASLEEGRNCVRMTIARAPGHGAQKLADGSPVKIIIRPDIEDRNMHSVTKAYAGAEAVWPGAVAADSDGFSFSPRGTHRLDMRLPGGSFTYQPEWQYMVGHGFEAERGLEPSGDLFSPGYFTCVLNGGDSAQLVAWGLMAGETASAAAFSDGPERDGPERDIPPGRALMETVRDALGAFIVKRGELKTVIAGYPWFLDWGRDTLICLRGLISAGFREESADILRAFGSLERQGTLPNMLAGDDDTNRDTSDAPLWFIVACRDLCRATGRENTLRLDCSGRSLREVITSIAEGYVKGTRNGIRMDADTGLIYSPAHYTWMDTHHPTGTPRQGYPIEIQALWHAALSFLADGGEDAGRWGELAGLVRRSVCDFFRRPQQLHLSDCLHAAPGQGARDAVADDALRPNQLLALTLGLVRDQELAAGILTSCEELLVPGAIRSLADRPVTVPIEVRRDGMLLNDPLNPYWGNYRGDEDTRRKPAYHNGTAWTWLFPSYPEALFMTFGEGVRDRARAILADSVEIIDRDCVGHVPEICDGDAPHVSRGCGAQAWGATELYRVLSLLEGLQT